KRAPLKRRMVNLSKFREELDARQEPRDGVYTIDGAQMSRADIDFTINILQAKQAALKVLMNTFYGKAGDITSPVYELLVAAGITQAGQNNIKLINEFVTSLGFTTHYGDSVTGDTPILCKRGRTILYQSISELHEGEWDRAHD